MTIKKKLRQFNHNVGWTLSLEVELKKNPCHLPQTSTTMYIKYFILTPSNID